jgi:hypothetical protein
MVNHAAGPPRHLSVPAEAAGRTAPCVRLPGFASPSHDGCAVVWPVWLDDKYMFGGHAVGL